MFKGAIRPIEEVQPAGRADPKIVILVDIKDIDMIIDQAGRVHIIVKETDEFFRAWVITIQSPAAWQSIDSPPGLPQLM